MAFPGTLELALLRAELTVGPVQRRGRPCLVQLERGQEFAPLLVLRSDLGQRLRIRRRALFARQQRGERLGLGGGSAARRLALFIQPRHEFATCLRFLLQTRPPLGLRPGPGG